ncbi:MAG: hypothetical protein P8Y23_12045 [Candidatus Lokiarchaeota archaeon]
MFAKPGNAPDISELPIKVKLKIWVSGKNRTYRVFSESSNPPLAIRLF